MKVQLNREHQPERKMQKTNEEIGSTGPCYVYLFVQYIIWEIIARIIDVEKLLCLENHTSLVLMNTRNEA